MAIAAILLVITGCSTAGPRGPSSVDTASVAPTSPDLAAVRATLDGLADAVRRDDESAFRALISTVDPSFRDRVRVLYANLTSLGLADLQFRPAAQTHQLTGARRDVFGGRAWVQSVTVEWRLTGETATADHQLGLTFIAEPTGLQLAGTIDGPTRGERQPIWALGPMTATHTGAVTVLTGAGQSAERWSGVVQDAAAEVRAGLPADLSPGSTATVVVSVPATETDFERILGAPAGSRRGIAAVTQIEGSADTAATHVVVNPRITESVTGDDLTRVLAHEIVHVATSSPRSAAPDWASEGLAEWVSLRDRPGRQSWATPTLLDRIRKSGAPKKLPTDADFAADGERQRLAYAQAWLLCRYIADRHSVDRLGTFYAALDRGDQLDEASRSILGVPAGELVAGWRSYLVRLARR